MATSRPLGGGDEPPSRSRSLIAVQRTSTAAAAAAAVPETRISVSRCTSPRSEPASRSSGGSFPGGEHHRGSLLPTGSRSAASRPSSRQGSRSSRPSSRPASRPASRSSQLAVTSGLHALPSSRRSSAGDLARDASSCDRRGGLGGRRGRSPRQERAESRSLSASRRPAQPSSLLSGAVRDLSPLFHLEDVERISSSVSPLSDGRTGGQPPPASPSRPSSWASRLPHRDSESRRHSPSPAPAPARPAEDRSSSPVLRRTSESTLSSQFCRTVGREEFAEYVQTHLPGAVQPELFDLADVRGQGHVSWLDVLDYLLLHARLESAQLERPFKEELLVGVLKENRVSGGGQ